MIRTLLGLLALACAFPALAEIRPATPTTLAAVVAASQPGDRIQLAAPDYARLTVSKKWAAPGVVLEPAPGTTPTVSLGVNATTFLTVRGFTLESWNPISNSSDITLEDCKVAPTGTNPMGVQINYVARPTIRRCEFIGGNFAIQGSWGNSDVLIEGNTFRGQIGDVIRDFRGVQRITIRKNLFTSPGGTPAAHRDNIQLWPQGQTIVDLVIEDNHAERGTSDFGIQNIFLAGDGGGGYLRPIIRRNSSLGAGYHGLALKYATDAIVADNFIQGLASQGAWMTLESNTYIEAARNWSTGNATGGPFVKIPAAADKADTAQLALWRAQFAPPPPPAPKTVEQRLDALEAAVSQMLAR